jgi:hypothetical protein
MATDRPMRWNPFEALNLQFGDLHLTQIDGETRARIIESRELSNSIGICCHSVDGIVPASVERKVRYHPQNL